MTRSKCATREAGKLVNTRTLGVTSLVLLLGTTLSWAGPPNPTASDATGNTAGGGGALVFNTTGSANTAFGYLALHGNTTGGENTASGVTALVSNTTGNNNTAAGSNALFFNDAGSNNTASGFQALYHNTAGGNNTVSGFQALYSNTIGLYNTAVGTNALNDNTEGSDNTAIGTSALFSNTTGTSNTASGFNALANNATGDNNTAVGLNAGYSNTIGSGNTFIGYGADTNAGIYTNGTALGYGSVLLASNSITLGNSFISAIYATVPITVTSDRRRKKDIAPLHADLGLDFIAKLKPVSYRYNNGDETERYGFIAQDLEGALPAALHDTIERSEAEHRLALIERQNDKDRTYRVSYDELLAPIVKAIQQQQEEIEAGRKQNAELHQQNADLRRSLEGQIAALQAQNEALRRSIDGLREQVAAR